LYTRLLTDPPFKLVRNGKPAFGTYKGVPSRIDIKGIEAPFGGFPLPAAFTRFRIRSYLNFVFNIGDYIGTVEFFDAKLFGFAEVLFWNTKTNTRLAYRTLVGPRKRLVPMRTSNAICASFRKSRYIRISWDRRYNRISLLFNVRGDSVRSSANGAFLARFTDKNMAEIVSVMPAPTMRRCSATWIAAMPIHGALSLGATKKITERTMADTDGLGILSLNRCYFKFHTKFEIITGLGISDTKKIQFRIVTSSLDAADTNKYNANVLFSDGEISPLPQVYVTHPFGVHGKWIIQDTESMVDLEFTPISDSLRKMNAVIISTVYHIIYGTFEGILLTKTGEKISLHNFPGIIKKSLLRL
jgi:hypothetical protein